MGAQTEIGWTDATYNPIGGCSIKSPGCTHCYAQRIAGSPRLANHPLYKGVTTEVKTGPVFNGKLTVAPDDHPIWTWPIRWRGSKHPKAGPDRPSMIFVGDMSDLFHEDRPFEVIDKVFQTIAYSPRHIFQLLTKRSKRMQEYFEARPTRILPLSGIPVRRPDQEAKDFSELWPLPNVWLGVSCEDQARADERIPDLLATPAAVRFVSYEPALGPIDFTKIQLGLTMTINCLTGEARHLLGFQEKTPNVINQIIYGGESGPDRRLSKIEWADSTMRQCKDAGTKFFFKQDGALRSGVKGRASDELAACKEFPARPMPAVEMAAGIIHEPGTNGAPDPAQGELL